LAEGGQNDMSKANTGRNKLFFSVNSILFQDRAKITDKACGNLFLNIFRT